MDNNNLKEFWFLYDQYILTAEVSLRPKLSALLRCIESKDRRTQLLRPEKRGWDTILAWQVLRYQEFIFSDNGTFPLYEGEIIAWTPHWDRDAFLTRNPFYETISGRYLKPGFKLTHEDKGGASDWEWQQTIRSYGLTNEEGLYLPIYDVDTLMKFCDIEIAKMRPRILSYLQVEKGYTLEVLNTL